jgi:hypothetical protein
MYLTAKQLPTCAGAVLGRPRSGRGHEAGGQLRFQPAFQRIATAAAADDRHTPRSASAMHLHHFTNRVSHGVPA